MKKVILVMHKERFEFIKKTCTGVKYLSVVDGNFIEFEMTFFDDMDYLNLFHAGRKFGEAETIKWKEELA